VDHQKKTALLAQALLTSLADGCVNTPKALGEVAAFPLLFQPPAICTSLLGKYQWMVLHQTPEQVVM
jgi:hypothetical protein